MARRKKIKNSNELEQWLLKKGAVPISKKMKKESWYSEVSKLPSCLHESTTNTKFEKTFSK